MHNKYPFTHWLVIGDWSNDGHNHKEFISLSCTHDEGAVKRAYIDACKKGNVSLHEESGCQVICCDYEDCKIAPEALQALADLGVNTELLEAAYVSPHDIVTIFAEMVKTQINNFEYKVDESFRPPTLNGFWSKDFNHQFGYGVFLD